MKGFSTSIDLILTNCKHNFKHTHTFETGLSDFHEMVTTYFKIHMKDADLLTFSIGATRTLSEVCFTDTCTFLSDLQAVPFEEAHSLENSELAHEKFIMLNMPGLFYGI